MQPLSSKINSILKKIFDLHHPCFGAIIVNWNNILGHHYSSMCRPLSIKSIKEKGKKINILNVETTNSSANLIITYKQDVIIERITVFFGFKAIEKLNIKNIPNINP